MTDKMRSAAKELSDILGFDPPIPADELEEEDLKSELLDAATELTEMDEITRSTEETLREVGAIVPEGIGIVDDVPKQEEDEPQPKKKGKEKPVAKKEKPKKEAKKPPKEKKVAKPEPKAPKKAAPKSASTPPPPVKRRAGRANTLKRRELMAQLIREGKWTHTQVVMKVCGQFPEYSPTTVITDLANAGNPDYCFYENVVGRNADNTLFFTKERGNGKYYYGSKEAPRGPARAAKKEAPKPKAAPKKKAEPKPKAPAKKAAPKKAAKKGK